jgi:N-acetylglucosamine-6-phosphate deacetylase
MAGLAAKIWSSLAITTLISSALHMTHMSQRTTISHLLLRLSLKEAAHIPRQQPSKSINLSQRKGELKKTHHQIQPLILLRQMTIAIRRKRRRLQLPLQRQA